MPHWTETAELTEIPTQETGGWRGLGRVLPGASVEEKEGAEKARRMGAHTSQRIGQPWERKEAQSLVVFDLLC